MSPCGAITTGRHLRKLMDISTHQTHALSEFNTLSADVLSSRFSGLTLAEYVTARGYFCNINHSQSCIECKSMIQAGKMVLEDGIVPLADVFKAVFPTVTYHSLNAKRRLLQMPVVAIRVKGLLNGQSKLYLMEKVEGLDYGQLANFCVKTLNQRSKESQRRAETIVQNHRS